MSSYTPEVSTKANHVFEWDGWMFGRKKRTNFSVNSFPDAPCKEYIYIFAHIFHQKMAR